MIHLIQNLNDYFHSIGEEIINWNLEIWLKIKLKNSSKSETLFMVYLSPKKIFIKNYI